VVVGWWQKFKSWVHQKFKNQEFVKANVLYYVAREYIYIVVVSIGGDWWWVMVVMVGGCQNSRIGCIKN
jgi:hypothetical protein